MSIELTDKQIRALTRTDIKLAEEFYEVVDALEKCVFLLSSIGYTPENSVTAMVARDLIAKAKGEQE